MLYQIPLTNSKLCAVVSEQDYDRCARKSWMLDGHGYVRMAIDVSHTYKSLKVKRPKLHQFIMGEVPVGYDMIDHINGDKLNNTRSNLRFVTASENNKNRQDRLYRISYIIKKRPVPRG